VCNQAVGKYGYLFHVDDDPTYPGQSTTSATAHSRWPTVAHVLAASIATEVGKEAHTLAPEIVGLI